MRPSNVSVICCIIAGWATGSAASPSSEKGGNAECKDKEPLCEQLVGMADEYKKEKCKDEPYKRGCRASCGKCAHVFHKEGELEEAAQEFDDDPANATRKYGPIEAWDVSRITKMRGLFRNKKKFDSDISSWNTSGVTDMSHMFEVRSDRPLYSDPHPARTPTRAPRAASYIASHFDSPLIQSCPPRCGSAQGAAKFNQPLRFDTSSVTSMRAMFNMSADDPDPCRRRLSWWSTFNSPLSFDTSSVTSMAGMFQGASAFNQALSFDTQNVNDMSRMFRGATAYDQPLSFDTSQVTDMADMFAQASAFNKPMSFATSDLRDMHAMFQHATDFNQAMSFDTSSVTDMSYMLQGATSFYQPLYFDFARVIDMSCMLAVTSCTGRSSFRGRRAQQLSCLPEDEPLLFNNPITLNTSSTRVTDLSGMFEGSRFNQPVSLDTSGVTSMKAMFRQASAFNQPLSFDTSSVTDMSDMFQNATAFDQPLSFDTSRVTEFSGMFLSASSLSDANKLIIFCAWAGNPAFESVYGSGWVSGACSPPSLSPPPPPPPRPWPSKPPHVFTCRDELRRAAQALNDNPANATQKYGPVETWDVSSITNMRGLFRGLKDFNSDVSSWNTSGVTDMSHMFEVRSDAPLYCDPHPAPRDPRSSSRVVFIPPTFNPAPRPVTCALRAARHRAR